VSGGDIRNAVLKAALAAAAEPGRDSSKAIHQRHLDEGMRDVVAGKRVMRQSLFDAQDSTIRHTVAPHVTLPGAVAVAALLVAIAAFVIAILALTH
jgi:hypothetical protein